MTQASTIATAIRPFAATAAPAAIIYLPEIHSRSGCYFPELGMRETSRAVVVADIVSGQHEHVVRVLALDLAAGTGMDASAELARDVLDQCLSLDGVVAPHVREFLEAHLGVLFVHTAERRAA